MLHIQQQQESIQIFMVSFMFLLNFAEEKTEWKLQLKFWNFEALIIHGVGQKRNYSLFVMQTRFSRKALAGKYAEVYIPIFM